MSKNINKGNTSDVSTTLIWTFDYYFKIKLIENIQLQRFE